MPSYEEVGVIWSKPGVGTPTQVCLSCGAVVLANQNEQSKHDAFHKALADLFSKTVSSPQIKSQNPEQEQE